MYFRFKAFFEMLLLFPCLDVKMNKLTAHDNSSLHTFGPCLHGMFYHSKSSMLTSQVLFYILVPTWSALHM